MRKITIIGSGPAGLTAAVYAARANLAPTVIEGFQTGGIPGGQLMITTDVENYPGFPEGIQGPELMEHFRKQAERFGTEFIQGDVSRVELREPPLRLWIGEQAIETRTLIIATGASAKWLGIPGEQLWPQGLGGRGVSACATCDGFFFKEMDVVVVGGGDTAMEEANFLTRMCRSVTVIHRRDQLRASKIMQDRAMKNSKISFIWNTAVTEVLGMDAGKVTGLRLKNLQTGEESVHPTQALFVAIGHQPNSSLFTGQLEMNETGYVINKPGSSYTSLPGVFAAGDIADSVYRQAVTAAGMGCMAAIDAERWLEAQEAH
jgi:thioredoxin reductase (NADPH)